MHVHLQGIGDYTLGCKIPACHELNEQLANVGLAQNVTRSISEF